MSSSRSSVHLGAGAKFEASKNLKSGAKTTSKSETSKNRKSGAKKGAVKTKKGNAKRRPLFLLDCLRCHQIAKFEEVEGINDAAQRRVISPFGAGARVGYQ